MPTLVIDGYNLLMGVGIAKPSSPAGKLEQARRTFVNQLIHVLDAEQRSQTMIVFDSALRLPDLADHYKEGGMEICFATGHQDADEMIIDLLHHHSAPKTVLVVSSDHQIQTAAKRRKAKFQDSDAWYEQFIECKLEPGSVSHRNGPQDSEAAIDQEIETKRSAQPVKKEVDSWVNQFSSLISEGLISTETQDGAVAEEFDSIPEIHEITDSKVEELEDDLVVQGTLKNEMLSDDQMDQWLDEFDQHFQEQGDSVHETEDPDSKKTPTRDAAAERFFPPPDRKTRQNSFDIGRHEVPVTSEAEDLDPLEENSECLETEKIQANDSTTDQIVPGNQEAMDTTLEVVEIESDVDVDEKQMGRWNRQLDQDSASPFPPGYGEDMLLGRPLPRNDADARWNKKRKS